MKVLIVEDHAPDAPVRSVVADLAETVVECADGAGSGHVICST